MAARIKLIEVLDRVVNIAKANAAVAAVVGAKVYNNVPQGTGYPYLGVRFQTTEKAPPKGSQPAYLCTVRFDGFSDQPSDKELLDLCDALVEAFDDRTFDVQSDSFTLDVCTFVSAAYALGEDGVTHLASYTFTFYASPRNF